MNEENGKLSRPAGRYFHIAVIFVLSFSVYINTFQNQFNYDDYPTLLENRAVTEPDVAAVLSGSRPMRQLTFIIDYKLFGRNPAGYHIENALFHAVNSVLLYRLLALLSFGTAGAFAASLLFSVHPINVEAVACIANRKELLALLFILLSGIYYIKAVSFRSGLIRNLTAAFVFYAAAVLSKQTAAFLPFMLIAYDYLFLKKEERVLGRLVIPLSLVIVLLSLYSRGLPDTVRPYEGMTDNGRPITFKESLFTAVTVFPLNLRYLALPFQLSADHTIMVVSGLSPAIILSLFVIAGYLAVLFASRRLKAVPFSLLWIVIFLIPTSNLIPGTSYFFAERYLYIPSVGFVALAGMLFEARRWRRASNALLILIIIVLSCLTVMRNAAWRDESTMAEDTVRKSPRSVFARNNYGNVLLMKGDMEGALREYEAAFRLNPTRPESLYNLANIYYVKGKKMEALRMYRSFLEVWKGDEGIGNAVKDRIRALESEGEGG